jgi:hypothetical protein
MKLFLPGKLLIICLLFTLGSAYAQTTTYDAVYAIFKANCTVGCHSGSSPSAQLDLSGTPATVYSKLINKAPVNPSALAKGDKLISPGDPHRSFLLRKCNNNLDPDNGIITAEGTPMPNNSSPLTKVEIETIRQWILFGAKDTGTQIDIAMLNTYYSGKGINGQLTPPTPPPAGQGFQLHVGPIFLAPLQEMEYGHKYDPKLADTMEINRLDLIMPKQSHHFLLYKFDPSASGNTTVIPGLRPLGSPGPTNAELVNAWQSTNNTELPTGTAYQWSKNTMLDYDFHVVNYNKDSVLLVDLRFNVYTQPKGTAKDVMITGLYHNIWIFLPNDNLPHTLTSDVYDAFATRMWNIWSLSSHTHKYATDYDIYERKADGSKGPQVFEGFYDFTYTYNKGYYDWSHPPIRKFEPTFHTINPRNGLINEAIYRNNGPGWVFFGGTTKDEMMLMFIQYTLGEKIITGVDEEQKTSPIGLNAFPNPYSESTQIVYRLGKQSDVKIEIFNLLGEKIKAFAEESQSPGNYNYIFSARKLGYQAGIYIARITVNGKTFTQKLTEIN